MGRGVPTQRRPCCTAVAGRKHGDGVDPAIQLVLADGAAFDRVVTVLEAGVPFTVGKRIEYLPSRWFEGGHEGES